MISSQELRLADFGSVWQLAHPNNKMVLAGRPGFFPTLEELKKALCIPHANSELIATHYCTRLDLQPLDESQIQGYFAKYYPDQPDKAAKFANAICANQNLVELAKRPAMLHIIRERIEQVEELSEGQSPIKAAHLLKLYANHWLDREEEKLRSPKNTPDSVEDSPTKQTAPKALSLYDLPRLNALQVLVYRQDKFLTATSRAKNRKMARAVTEFRDYLRFLWLRSANLQGAHLSRFDLQGANLQRANLQDAESWGAKLQGANLQGANLQGANLQGANLQGANLEGARDIPKIKGR